MKYEHETPFDNVEGAHEYLTLLIEVVRDAKKEVESDLAIKETNVSLVRHTKALRVVLYNLERLERHMKISRRLLNDLRSLRRLILQERAESVVLQVRQSAQPTARLSTRSIPA
jgi:hypothetical protein